MVLRTHVDKRGLFQELFRESESEFTPRQVSRCTINPGFFRGGHYHKKMTEAFIVLEGEMLLEKRIGGDPTDEGGVVRMTIENNQIMYNKPGEWHLVYSQKGCTFMILSDLEFDPLDPDVYS